MELCVVGIFVLPGNLRLFAFLGAWRALVSTAGVAVVFVWRCWGGDARFHKTGAGMAAWAWLLVVLYGPLCIINK